MAWDWKKNSMESADDFGGGNYAPPPQTAPAARPATAAPPPAQQPRTMAPAAPQQTRSVWQEAGDFLFGSGEKAGILGTGQYKVNDPSVRMGAGALPNAAQTSARVAQGITDAQGRQVGTDFRNAQAGLLTDLQAASRGEGLSVAQEQLRQGTSGNLSAAVAAANSIRGPGGAVQAGQLMAQRAQATQQGASDAAVLRAQEIGQARGQLADLSQSGRSLDMNEQAQRDEMVRYYTSLGFDADRAQQAANTEMEQLRIQTQLQVEQMRQAAYDASAARNGQLTRDVVGGLAKVAGIPAGGKP